MRIRTVITGISAAVLCIIVLRFQYYRIGLSKYVPGWANEDFAATLPGWVYVAVLIFCCIIIFASGWIAARWSWANNRWRSLKIGAQMGLLAGCLIYDFIGIFLFSVKEQGEILRSYNITIAEAEGTRIFTEALVQTGAALYTYFILTVLACVLLGCLGGFVSAVVDRRDFWGKHPRNPEGWLFRSTFYLLTLTGFLNMVVALAALSYLRPRIMNTITSFAEQFGETLSVEFYLDLFLISSTLILWMFAYLPAGITCGWIIRAWVTRKRTNFLSKVWLTFSTIGLLVLTWLVSPSVFTNIIDLACIFIAFSFGIVIGLLSEDQSEGFTYHLSDWVGYGFTFGILSGTETLMGILAYFVSTALIGIVNIPHLVSRGEVESEPVQQVLRLFDAVNFYGSLGIFASIAIGLLVISFVAFLRSIMGIKETTHNQR